MSGRQELKKALKKSGYFGATCSLVFFLFFIPFVPAEWNSLIGKLSIAFTYLGWTVGGFAVGTAIGAIAIAVTWTVRTASGNWTRVGR